MKNLVLIIAIACVGYAANAQTKLVSSNTHALVNTLDTVTNTGSKTMSLPLSARLSGLGQTTVVTTYNAALTGTMKGVATLWGSTNGVKFERVRSTALHGGQVDSLLLDAAHPNYAWIVDNVPFNYYQVVTTGVGTTTFTVSGELYKK
jgi:hypothetical protein